MLRGAEILFPALVRERAAFDDRARGGVNPIFPVGSSRKIQDQGFMIRPWVHNIVHLVVLEFALVMIQRILFSRLAEPPAVSSMRHAADHKAPVRSHLDEVKAEQEVLQIAQRAQHLGVIRRIAGRVLRREARVQMIKAGAPSHHELPGFHPGSCDRIRVVIPPGVPGGFV